MNKIGIYILLIVVGGVVGASALYFIMPNQTPSVTEPEVKVTIQGIEYVKSDYPVLEVELLNDATEKNLDGTVDIYQGDKHWTSEVTWYYTGYGEAAILVDTINENQSFRITYNEKNPQAIYLDRTIQWYEVETGSLTTGFMETKEATITDVTFSESDTITCTVTNTGTAAVTIAVAKVNGVSQTFTATGSTTIASGSTEYINIDFAFTVGNKYKVTLFTSDGTLLGSYTGTA
jgi:hypothetical protein